MTAAPAPADALWVHTARNRAFVRARDVSEVLLIDSALDGVEPAWGVWIQTTAGNRHLVVLAEDESHADDLAQDLLLALATDHSQGMIALNGTTFELCQLGSVGSWRTRR
uniref:hypothetical protein n=1 Tax=Saccharothrix espanaensis TaxID=103731 RepID=UPI003F496A08